MAQLQDAREAEAAAVALAERTRIAGELHDVLAHSLSGLAIQLQGARKLADREQVSAGLRATIERSAELTKAGLADARQAVGALRGDRLPGLDQLGALVDDFRHDTGSDATLRIDGTSRVLPAEASLARSGTPISTVWPPRSSNTERNTSGLGAGTCGDLPASLVTRDMLGGW